MENISYRYILNRLDFKKDIFIIHGLFEYPGVYEKTAQRLSDKGYKAHLIGMQGFGNLYAAKEALDFYSVFEFLERTVPSDYVLFGSCLGAVIAASFSIKTEKKPSKLILSSPMLLDRDSSYGSLGIDELNLRRDIRVKMYKDPYINKSFEKPQIKKVIKETEFILDNTDRLNMPVYVLRTPRDTLLNDQAVNKIKKCKNIKVSSIKSEDRMLFYNPVSYEQAQTELEHILSE